MLQDVRYAWRLLTRAPSFAVAAVLTLALGIGANTAIFSVVRSVLFAPLPFTEPGRLVTLWHSYGTSLPRAAVSPPGYFDLRDAHDIFQGAAAFTLVDVNLTGSGEPERLSVARATASFQPVLGLRVERGRWFGDDEDAPDRNRVIVLGHGLWVRRFGGDPSIVGRSVLLNGRSHLVLGIMAESAVFPRGADAWIPIAFTPDERSPGSRGWEFLDVVARLQPGLTMAQARDRVGVLAGRLRDEHYARVPRWTLGMRPLADDLVHDARPIVVAMSCAVAFVLLIACVNVASLTLARAAHRTREFAVRAALGADPGRLRRQLLTETATLGLLGGVAGALVASVALPLVARGATTAFSLADRPHMDAAAFLFALAAALASSIAFGLTPAWRASRADLRVALGDTARGAIGGAARTLLVAAEIALAFALLVGAGLLVRSFARIIAVDPGFATAHRLTARVSLPVLRYPSGSTARAAFYDQLFARLSTVPGVVAAGGVSELPLGELRNMGSFDIREQPTPKGQEGPHGDWRSASPGYFRAMGIALVRGRLFSDRDGAGAPPVVLVDEQAARRLWPRGDVLGAHISIDDPALWHEVVGVVSSVHHDALDEPARATVYFPLAQRATATVFAVVDGGHDAERLAGVVRATVRALDPDLPVYDVRTLEDRLDDSLGRRRMAMWLVTAFSLLAALLAVVGVYGVTTYDVSQRTQEIAIRMALGADRGRVLAWVLGRCARSAVIGLGAGVVLALVLTRAGSGLLFGVAANDAPTYVVLAAVVAVITAAAGYVPARRATRVDPIAELR